MSTGQVITVTWMDGQVQKYDHVVDHRVADGMLTIRQEVPVNIRIQSIDILPPDLRTPARRTLHLPLANIRVWEDPS